MDDVKSYPGFMAYLELKLKAIKETPNSDIFNQEDAIWNTERQLEVTKNEHARYSP